MFNAPYDIGPIRPPSEAESLLIRVNRNCPWNRCGFCNVYKGTKFGKKSLEEIKADIDAAAEFYGSGRRQIRSAFLQDANPLVAPAEIIVGALKYLREKFPDIERVTTYARADTVARLGTEKLKALRKAGLDRLHIGLETAHDPLLKFMDKGVTRQQYLDAGAAAKAAGMELSVYVMPGLGGREMSRGHALDTASALNATRPDFIRLRTTVPRPETPLYEAMERGEWTPLSEEEIIAEIRLFIDSLDGVASRVVSDHMMNLMQEVEGGLPEGKNRMLESLDAFLALSPDDKELFIVGARARRLWRVEDLRNPQLRAGAEAVREALRAEALRLDPSGGMTAEAVLRRAMEEVI